MSLQNEISEIMGISEPSAASLERAVSRHQGLPDRNKREVNRRIALAAIGSCEYGKRQGIPKGACLRLLSSVKVLGVNHAGPLDVTLNWQSKGKRLRLLRCNIDAGGDQINVSKVFSNFKERIALVALSGKKNGRITQVWERKFLGKMVIAGLIRCPDDVPVQVYNILDGKTLPGMHGWQDPLKPGVIDKINSKTMEMLEGMLGGKQKNVWMLLSAGGPIRYDPASACYANLVKKVKERYGSRVNLLIDFKFMSGPEEAMSVLKIARKSPQDIIKPNLQEFIQILCASGITKPGQLKAGVIGEAEIKKQAVSLRKRYNLAGVLVSMDKSGVLLVLEDRIIREKGIKITLASPTAAGDSLKAGFVYSLSQGGSFEEAVHTGNLFGAATASMPGSRTVTPGILAGIKALARKQKVFPVVEKI